MEELSLKDSAQPVKYAHLQVGDKIVRLKEAFASQDTQKAGKICLADVKMAFRTYTNTNLTPKDLRTIIKAHDSNPSRSSVSDNASSSRSSSSGKDNIFFDFEHFCFIVSEFKPTKSEKCQGASAGGNSGKLKGKKLWSSFSRKVGHVCRTMLHPFGVTSNSSPSSNSANNYSKDTRILSTQISSNSSGAGETSHYHLRRSPLPQLPRGRRGSSIRDVYLGGSSSYCETSWQERDAIPMLKKNGLTFFLPPPSSISFSKSRQICSPLTIGSDSCRKRLMPIEAARVDNSRVLLFVILGSSRSVSAMCEAAYHIGMGRGGVVLCVQKIPEDGKINNMDDEGETITRQALKDYNRGRSYLSDIANREGVPVFENISEALDCVVQKCKRDYPSSAAR